MAHYIDISLFVLTLIGLFISPIMMLKFGGWKAYVETNKLMASMMVTKPFLFLLNVVLCVVMMTIYKHFNMNLTYNLCLIGLVFYYTQMLYFIVTGKAKSIEL